VVKVKITSEKPQLFTLHLRKPSWAGSFSMIVDGGAVDLVAEDKKEAEPTATGYDPRRAGFVPVSLDGRGRHEIEIRMEMPVCVLRPHSRVRALRGKAAVSRGPTVYCLESIDNPGVDIFNCLVDRSSLKYTYRENLLGGTGTIHGNTRDGVPIQFIPYSLWGNRGPSGMTVWVKIIN
jgi:DUF1680 family protein